MGDNYELKKSYDTQIAIVKSMIFAMNSKQKIIRQELVKAMKNVLFKYYEFNMATEGLLQWNDNPDFKEKKVEKEKEKEKENKGEKEKEKEKMDEKASFGPQYRIICDKKDMKKRQATDNRGALWEPIIVKVNVGVPRKEVRIVDDEEECEAVIDLEIDCSGLLLDGIEVYHDLQKKIRTSKKPNKIIKIKIKIRIRIRIKIKIKIKIKPTVNMVKNLILIVLLLMIKPFLFRVIKNK